MTNLLHMVNTTKERQEIFAGAILKTVEQRLALGELGPLGPPVSFKVEDLCLVLGGMLADGDAGYSVWLAGREFCAALLHNIPNADSYEVCTLLREAIEHHTSVYDDRGEHGQEFVTQEYAELFKPQKAFSLST